MLVYGKCECFVMQMLYVCVLCASCSSSQYCMTCSLLMLVEDAIGDHTEETILQSRSHNCLIGIHECLLLFTPSCCCECFYHLQWLVCLY